MKHILKHLQNQRGNTLMENLIAVFLLAMFAVLASLLLLAAAKQIAAVRIEDAYINEVSVAIETTDTSTVAAATAGTDDIIVKSGGSLSFSLGDVDGDGITDSVTIDGTYIYDTAESRLGEFVRNDATP